jgi:hypothetical protein
LKRGKKARSVLHMNIMPRMGKNFKLGMGEIMLGFRNMLGA